MTNKEKYTVLMQRYFEGETTPEEERDLARYASGADDAAFDAVRGVLGYLSVGRELKARRTRKVRLYSFAAAAAGLAAILALGLGPADGRLTLKDNQYVLYTYGERTDDPELIMASVESSLADFFSGDTPMEANLTEMFQR